MRKKDRRCSKSPMFLEFYQLISVWFPFFLESSLFDRRSKEGHLSETLRWRWRTRIFRSSEQPHSEAMAKHIMGNTYPIGSMYGIYTYIGIILNYLRVNVGKYSIHGSSGYVILLSVHDRVLFDDIKNWFIYTAGRCWKTAFIIWRLWRFYISFFSNTSTIHVKLITHTHTHIHIVFDVRRLWSSLFSFPQGLCLFGPWDRFLKDPELLEKLDKEETGGYSVVAEKAEGHGPHGLRLKLAKTHGFSMVFPISVEDFLARKSRQVGGWNFLKDWWKWWG